MQQIIKTTEAPAPIGPYSQAVRAGGFLFVSGQIALDTVTGELRGEDAAGEAEQVMKNLEAILKEAGLGFGNVVKTTIFLQNMNDFTKVNEVYGRYFTGNFPARETVQAAALPKNVRVEISLTALI